MLLLEYFNQRDTAVTKDHGVTSLCNSVFSCASVVITKYLTKSAHANYRLCTFYLRALH
jgi:hypothetical protein